MQKIIINNHRLPAPVKLWLDVPITTLDQFFKNIHSSYHKVDQSVQVLTYVTVTDIQLVRVRLFWKKIIIKQTNKEKGEVGWSIVHVSFQFGIVMLLIQCLQQYA